MGNTSIKKNILIISCATMNSLLQSYQKLINQHFVYEFLTLEELIKTPKIKSYDLILIGNQIKSKFIAYKQTFHKSDNILDYSYFLSQNQSLQNPHQFFNKIQKIIQQKNYIHTPTPSLHKNKFIIKFVDSQVTSTPYQIFINYMKNKKIKFQTYSNVSDFISSQKISQTEYVICSKQFLKSMLDLHKKVICFCSKTEEDTVKAVNSTQSKLILVQNNFIKIIKHISRQLENANIYNYPIKTIIIFTIGLSTNFLQLINRKKIKVRVIKSKSIQQIMQYVSKELYSTVIINNDQKFINMISQKAQQLHVRQRLNLLRVVGNEQKFLNSLDEYIQKGYQIIPRKLKQIFIIGQNQIFDQIKKIRHRFYQKQINTLYLKFNDFKNSKIYPLAIITNSVFLTQIKQILQENIYKTMLICYQKKLSCNQSHSQNTLVTSDPDKVIDLISNQIYYLSQEFLIDEPIWRITDCISKFQLDKVIFIDFSIQQKQFKWQSTLKFLSFQSKQSRQQNYFMQNFCRLWNLTYDPIQQFQTFKFDIIKSLKQMSLLQIVHHNIYELQHKYLQYIRNCSHFSQLLKIITDMYKQDVKFRAQINVILGSIDQFYDFSKILVLKPLIVLLINNYSVIFNSKYQCFNSKTSMVLKINKRSFHDILNKSSYLINTQFIQCHPVKDKKIKLNENYIRIQIQTSNLRNTNFNHNFILMQMDGRLTYLIPPLSKFKIIKNPNGSQILTLKLINKTTFSDKIIQKNVIKLNLETNNYTDLMNNKYFNERLVNTGQKKQLSIRLIFYDFVKSLKKQKYFEAQKILEELKFKVNQSHKQIICISNIQLCLARGMIYKATQHLKNLVDDTLTQQYKKQLQQLQKKIYEARFQVKNIQIQKQIKWTVNYVKKQDKFCLINNQNNYEYNWKSNSNSNSQIIQNLLQSSLGKSNNSWINDYKNKNQSESYIYEQFYKTNNFGQYKPKTKISTRTKTQIIQSDSEKQNQVIFQTNESNYLDNQKDQINVFKKKHYKIVRKCRNLKLV